MALYLRIVDFHGPCALVCDGRCDKAWGINGRPREQHSADPDDYTYLSDSVLQTAPPPGQTRTIAEGRDVKPSAEALTGTTGHVMGNRWCARECERCGVLRASHGAVLAMPPDLEYPTPNLPTRAKGGA